jgi:peptidoglycan/xylan/chitin deacetylase (PgdA/CDA1 family)
MRLQSRWLKQPYFRLLQGVGHDRRLLRRIRQRGAMVVLNLHQVSPHANPFWSPLHPRVFEDLLRFLTRHFRVTSFRERGSTGAERPLAILSFDDGYASFVEYAMPLLRRYGLSANQNVIPACVESGRAPWNVRLYDFLNAAPRALINEIRLPGFSHRLTGRDADSKRAYALRLSRFLKLRPQSQREPLWQRVEAVMEQAPPARPTRMMSLEEVREASREHEIGAHSFSHESMGFESAAFFEEDLERCVGFFRDRLGLALSIYAFPNGSYRPEQIELLAQRGVEHILLVEDQLASANGRVIPRLTMSGESRLEARFQALGHKASCAGSKSSR